MSFNRKNKDNDDDFGRVLNPVPGLMELIEKNKINPSRLSIAFPIGDDNNIISEDRTNIILVEMEKNRHIEWSVDSLRALFRGTKNPPPDHEMAHYPDEYVGFFHGIEKYVHSACSNKKPYPFDEQFIEIYSMMRRRPDSKSTGIIHDVAWQAAALVLGLREWSEAEYIAVFAQLTRSVRTFSIGKDSRNYIEYLNGTGGETKNKKKAIDISLKNQNKEIHMRERIAKVFAPAEKWIKVMAFTSVTGLILTGMGCATANVDVLSRPSTNLVLPDYVLIHDLAVTPDEVTMDKGFAAQAIRDSGDQTQSQLEIQVGHAVAKALTDGLVENLRLAGIRAGAARDGLKPTDKTLVIYGKFVRIDQGNQSLRVWVGFGFGNGEMQALMECSQDGRFINKAMVTTSGSLKPGLAVPVAGGAAAGTILISSVVAGSATGLSETFLSTVQADANRASKEVAKKIVQGYINHGWLKPDALEKLNTFF